MENKELKALFDAKRTVEANRRRQEELRRMMAASAAPKSRRLWPVWALSAAASIALLLITLPLLFHSETAEPLLVAEAILPQKEEPAHSSSSPKLGEGDPRNEGGGVCKTADKHTPPSTLRVSTPSLPGSVGDIACDRSGANLEGELADAVEKPVLVTESKEQHPEDTPIEEASLPNTNFQIPTTDTPTIHRRTSTQMVCSNCKIDNIPSPNTTLQDFLAASFASETSTSVTLKTIEF